MICYNRGNNMWEEGKASHQSKKVLIIHILEEGDNRFG